MEESLPPLEEMIDRYDLGEEIATLDEQGLVVISQAKLKLPDAFFERLRNAILRVAEARTGAKFDLHKGVNAEFEGVQEAKGQMLLTHLLYEDPVFLEVLTHPVKKVMMRHMLGDTHRVSFSNAWIKWQTPADFTGELTTGMHADQDQVPAPWNIAAPHTLNMNWLLTDYSAANGALVYVPGSHKYGRPAKPGEAAPQAVPVEAPAGSLMMFQGGTWHGAIRKQTPGLRISMHGLHVRPYYLVAQDFKGRVPQATFEASDDPAYLRMLLREDELMLEPNVGGKMLPLPKIKRLL